MSGSNAQVSRIYAILDMLDGNPAGLSVTAIQTQILDRGHKASKRTIYRDLEALAQAGFPLFPRGEKSDHGGTKWLLERNTRINDYLVLSYRELASLYLARHALLGLKETPIYEDIQNAFKKIENKLGTKAQQYLAELSHECHFEPGPKWGFGLDANLLECVRAATSEQQVLICQYKSVSGNTERQRQIGPHFLYFAKGSIYLVGEDLESKSVKIFSLARMQNCEMSETPYDGIVSDPNKLFAKSFGIFTGNEKPQTVKIEFTSKVSQYVQERIWHPSQKIENKQNGTIILQFEVQVSEELRRWILGFGSNAKVIEPSSLIDQLVEEATAILGSYLKRAA